MNWRTIKNFGQIKYFNISYAVLILIPIIANIFEVLNSRYGQCLHVPITVKSLYATSILYAIAIAIYQYRCPPLIKEYVNVQDYIEKNLDIFKNKAPDLKLNIVLAHLDKSTQEATFNEIVQLFRKCSGTEGEEKILCSQRLDAKLDLVYSSTVQSHLEKKYEIANKQEPGSYWASGVLYVIGTLIIIILLILRTIVVFTN